MTWAAGNKITAAKLNPGMVRRYQSVAQTNIADNTPTILTFDIPVTSSADVSYDNTKGAFTINRHAWWRIETSGACNANGTSATGERLLTVVRNPTTITAGAKPTYSGGTAIGRDADHPASGQFGFTNVATSRELFVGDVIVVSLNVVNTTSAVGTYVNGEQIFIALTAELDL